MDIEGIKKHGIEIPTIKTYKGSLWDDNNLGLRHPWVWVYNNSLEITLPPKYIKFKKDIIEKMNFYSSEMKTEKLKSKYSGEITERITFIFKDNIELPDIFQSSCPSSIGLKRLFEIIF